MSEYIIISRDTLKVLETIDIFNGDEALAFRDTNYPEQYVAIYLGGSKELSLRHPREAYAAFKRAAEDADSGDGT